jgi:hypothetical protein
MKINSTLRNTQPSYLITMQDQGSEFRPAGVNTMQDQGSEFRPAGVNTMQDVRFANMITPSLQRWVKENKQV